MSNPLTRREREILRMVSEGLQRGEIAEQLSIEPTTVAKHLSNAMAKLQARTRAHAVAIAYEHRLF